MPWILCLREIPRIWAQSLQGPRAAPLTSSTVHRATSLAWMLATPGRSLQCCSLPRGRSRKGWADTEDMKMDWCSACCVCSAEYSGRETGWVKHTHGAN